MTHLVPHVTDIGFSEVEAATSLSLVGAAIIAGTIIMGIVSDKIGRKTTVIICLLTSCGSMLWLIWAYELWALYLFALVFGFAAGGFGASIPALIGETFGLGSIGVIVGFMDASHGVGTAAGPIIGGLIFDASGSYDVAFFSGAVALLVISLLTALIRR